MSTYRDRMIAKLEEDREEAAQDIESAFDPSATTRKRIAALNRYGAISDEAKANRALEIVEDDKANAKLRAAFLTRISDHFGQDEWYLEKLTLMMSDQKVPDEIREAAFKSLQSSSFSSLAFQSRRPVYLSTLRGLVDDENDTLREAAIEYLAMNRDDFVQRRLVEGLQSPKKKITKPELAIQYLAYDLHADHFPLLRKLAAKPPNKKTRMEALRNLAADASSVDLLEDAMGDKTEDPELRHLCAVALQRLEPDRFEKTANRILRGKTENEALKLAIVNTRLHTPGSDLTKVKSDLTKVLKSVSDDDNKTSGARLSNLIARRPQA